MLVKTMFFPIGRLIVYLIYFFIIKALCLFDDETASLDDVEIQNCLVHAFCADSLFVIPVFGTFLQKISFMINLYARLRIRLGFDFISALFVIVCPLLFLVCFLFFSINCFLILFKIFF